MAGITMQRRYTVIFCCTKTLDVYHIHPHTDEALSLCCSSSREKPAVRARGALFSWSFPSDFWVELQRRY